MEAALLASVLKVAGNKLVPLLASECSSIRGVMNDLLELQRSFGEITGWLSAVGAKAAGSDPSFYWLKDLKDVACDFDDLLNRVHLEAEKHKADVDVAKNVLATWYLELKYILSRAKKAHTIKKIKMRFAAIVKQRIDFNAIANSTHGSHPVRHRYRAVGQKSTLVNIDETKVIGRDVVKHEILSELVGADTRERISIISVVGLGGSGKTTLANYICQDKNITDHFEMTIWVHVSEEFNVEMLIGKLFESVTDEKSEHHTLQHMVRKISENLSTRKFLLILDDVWNKDHHDWEQFEQHFHAGAPGSKILLTTRDEKVAEVVNSTNIFNLASLSDDVSWKLFQQSSGWAEEGLDSEFIEVGKSIMKKCAGVPLAIISLASVLRGKREIKEWRALRDSNLLKGAIQGRVLGSLMLNYFHLSDDLKQCFLLCSIFPKGYRMYKDHLIAQWIAHGFVDPTNGGRQLEDMGTDYFDSLLKVSFLQDLVEDQSTGRLTCKMHDLVHDLTRQILQDEIFLTSSKTTTYHNQICRYLSLAACTEKVASKLFKKTRALYVTGGGFATDMVIKKGCCVRSVILEKTKYTSLPPFILRFEYLGYLRISNVLCRELPEAITGCWNLQALHVIYCSRFAMLPSTIGKLRKLRTLEVSQSDHLVSLPQSIGDCHSLESLYLIKCSKFRVIPDSVCKIENLRVLHIINCESLRRLPLESFGMLLNLRSIDLTGCKNLEDLPNSFACEELHTLKLPSVATLTTLPRCTTSLMDLEHLSLKDCQELVELPEGIGNLKRLKVLNIEGCCKLRGLPTGFGQLTRLQRLGLFVVGDSCEHARLSELGNLDMLSGVLEIQGIRYVKDPDDAERAYLKKKKAIKKLILNWLSTKNQIGTSTEEEIDMERELAVLDGLEPPSGIVELGIGNYQGLHLPCWMTKGRYSCNLENKLKQTVGLSHFPHLSGMVLDCFPNLKHLMGLVELPSLKTLMLSRFDALESINAGPFPSLKYLRISGMRHLLELATMTFLADKVGVTVLGCQTMQCCFPCLSTLHIEDCPKLNLNPQFAASLENLTLIRSNDQLLSPFVFQGSSFGPADLYRDELPSSCSDSDGASCLNLIKRLTLQRMSGSSPASAWGALLCHVTALRTLQLSGCNELMHFSDSMVKLTTLREPCITECPDLCMLPEWLGELHSLQSLSIIGCKNLNELPEGIGHLTSLQWLKIRGCHTLGKLPELCELRSLRVLEINNLPSLTNLPESMRGLTSLVMLSIDRCDALRMLPNEIGELHSLRTLFIGNLPALAHLPKSMRGLCLLSQLVIIKCHAVKVLPQWIGELSALQLLWIQDCSSLTFLPRSIQCLAKLHTLRIISNPLLPRLYDLVAVSPHIRFLDIS